MFVSNNLIGLRPQGNATGARSVRFLALFAGGFLLAFSSAQAEFVLVEHFDDAVLGGDVDEQNGWDASGGINTVVLDPADASNQALFIPTSSSTLQKSLSAMGLAIPEGGQGTLFLRLRVEDQQNFSVGLSPLGSPDEYSDFGPEIGMASSAHDLDLRVWDDDAGNYSDVTQLVSGTWYNLWVSVDQTLDAYQAWLNAGDGLDAAGADLLTTTAGTDTFGFRSGTTGDLQTFYLKTSGGSSGTTFGPVHLDDIYIDLAVGGNLTNPTGIAAIPEPATGGLFLILLACLLRPRSRL